MKTIAVSAGPWDRYPTVMEVAGALSGLDITRLENMRGRIRYHAFDIYPGSQSALLCMVTHCVLERSKRKSAVGKLSRIDRIAHSFRMST